MRLFSSTETKLPDEERRLAELSARGSRRRLQGDPAGAEPLLRAALALTERLFPDDSDRIVAALNALGLVCKDLAKYDEGRAAYTRALALLESAPSPHPDRIATLYHNLGGMEHARGDYGAGEPLARKGLDIRRRIAHDDDPELAADLVALAAILDGQRKFDEAESLYSEALRILEAAPDGNAAELGVAFNDLGAQCARRGELHRAEKLLVRAIEVKTRRLGTRHPDVGVTLNNLAFVHERTGAAAARGEYRGALDILEHALGPGHPKSVACRRNYERCLAVNSRM